MAKKIFLIAIASVVIFFFSGSFASAATPAKSAKLNYKDGQLIVRFTDPSIKQMRKLSRPMSRRAIRNVITNVILRGSSVTKEFDSIVPGLSVIKLPKNRRVANSIAKFDLSSAVIYVEPSYKYQLLATPNDQRYSQQWPLNNTGQANGTAGDDIDAENAWDIQHDANNVIVAVIDSGVDINHPDLNANCWRNVSEDPNNNDGVDNDKNGYIDDRDGWDFAGADGNNPYDGDNDPSDKYGHGTHVAGTIGAVGNNSIGVTGVCWKVQLMRCKVNADNSGNMLEGAVIVEAIGYAVKNYANVINASWGGGSFSIAIYDAINYARQNNVLFVAAAGNNTSNNDGAPFYPASYNLANIVSVMATGNYDQVAYYSCYGATTVDLAAPGGEQFSTDDPGGVLSTIPGTTENPANYAFYQGTSMAAPHVAGAASLMLAVDPCMAYTKTKAILLNSVDKLPGLTGLCVSGGRLNLFEALRQSQAGVVALWEVGVRKLPDPNTIQEAIDRASVDGAIVIAQADRWYFETLTFPSDVNITVRSGMDPCSASALSDPNVYPDNTFISGLFGNGTVITIGGGLNLTTVLKGFTVRDGGDGGLDIDGASPTITDCTISKNSSVGILCQNGADPNISECTISDNTSSDNGGGIFCDGGSDANIVDCTIINNTSSATGGGIYCLDSSPSISNSTVSGNISAWEGGGVYLDNSPAAITDCTISNNTSAWDGGGIYCNTGSDAVIQNSTISGNIANYDCGGIYCNTTSPTIKNNLFIDNTVESWDGGAILCNAGSPSITNCTFVNNSGNPYDGRGGAIFCVDNSDPAVTDCIFKDNPDYAIYESDAASDPNITFCLFYNNPDGNYNAYNPVGSFGNIAGDPMFVPGRLGNYYLSSGAAGQILDPNGDVGDANSPAIDAGSATAASLSMDAYSTRTDVVVDGNQVDIGFHYNDPNTVADTYTLDIDIQPTGTSNAVTTVPASGPFKQFAQVLLKATPASTYQLKSWNGTDNDAATDLNGDVDPNNIVTMSNDKTVIVTFETILVELRVATSGTGGFSLSPSGTLDGRKVMFPRGTVVTITATPTVLSDIVRWDGSDNDNSIGRTNKVTIDGKTAQFVNSAQVVDVTFYAPNTLDVPGDYTNIQRAIDAANSGDIIKVAAGTYNITSSSEDNAGLRIDGKNITITSSNPDDPCVVDTTILTGGWLEFSNVDRNCLINGITIQDSRWVVSKAPDGGATGNPSTDGDGMDGGGANGGAVELVGDASPTFRNCVIKDNSLRGGHGGNGACPGGDGGWGGWGHGGGVYVGFDGNPMFVNCLFQNCIIRGGDGGNGCLTSPGGHGGSWGPEDDPRWFFGPYEPYWKYSGYGGAVYCETGSTPEFVDCDFVDNHAYGGSSGESIYVNWGDPHFKIDSFGGAVYCASQSSPKFTNCNFVDNEANSATLWHEGLTDQSSDMAQADDYITYGGAIAYEDDATPTFENCMINGSAAHVGGAVYGEWADGRFGDCNIVNNRAYLGGGVYFVGGTNRIGTSIISQNQAAFTDPNLVDTPTEGGGIYIFDANVMITDCNINGNSSTASGGGMYIAGSNTPLIKNCLIFNNTADRDGGGISANWYSHPTITNCTIADNTVSGTGFAAGYGGGMYVSYGSYAQIINSILWGNSDTTGKNGQIAIGTGFEYDRRPADVNVAYSDVQGGASGVYFDPGVSVNRLHWDYVNNLIGLDPKFVKGYRLSQPVTKDKTQTTLSPCVDKGKGNMATDVNTLHLYRGTTRTDRNVDTSRVDMGYHYLRYADIDGDYNFNGVVDGNDLKLFLQNWLYSNCDFPYWCDDRDLNQDGTVDNFDREIFYLNYGKVERTPPNPNLMTWEITPMLNGTKVTMRATTAVDNSGFPVQYYFERTDANGMPDGKIRTWSADANYIDTITAGGTYGYRVKARDYKLPEYPLSDCNETEWSAIAFAVPSSGGGDTSKPTSLKLTASNITATGFTLTASATDASKPITYEFTCTVGGGPSRAFGGAVFNVSGLTNNTSYTYKMRAKDARGNISGYLSTTVRTSSDGGSGIVDTIRPIPEDPYGWVIFPREISFGSFRSHTMECCTALPSQEGGTVWYRFVCDDYSGVSSGWRTGDGATTWTVNVGGTHYYRWHAEAKDDSGDLYKVITGPMVWVSR